MRAFVYTEGPIDSEKIQEKTHAMYVLHYSGNSTAHCERMQSEDERFFIQTLKDLNRRNKITLLEMLPPNVKPIEGNIKRKPYDLSFLNKTSASH